MTDGEPKPRKPRTTRKRAAPGAQDEAALKARIVEAALMHVPFDGFTDKTLERAAADARVERSILPHLFPDGPRSLVEAFSELADMEMVKRLSKVKLSSLKVRERIATAVKTRIAAMKPHKEAARRAAAYLTLPPHAALGLKLLYQTVDSIWRAIGDTSTDFSFYTKRAILAGVYSTTLMRWFTDESEDEADTAAFLAARIEDVMRFEKLKAEIREQAKKLPSLSEIFNPSSRTGSRRRS